MEKHCKVHFSELYGNTPVSDVFKCGDEVYFVLPSNIEKTKINFFKGTVKQCFDYGLALERINGDKVIKHFVERNQLFMEVKIDI